MYINKPILSQTCINLQSKTISSKWAAQMLKHWGADILYGNQTEIKHQLYNLISNHKKLAKRILITITDQSLNNTQQINQHLLSQKSNVIHIPTILLTHTNISSLHIAAISGHLSTFGQQPQYPFYPNHLIQMAGATGIFTSVLKQIHLMKDNIHYQKVNKNQYIFIPYPIIQLSLVDLMRYNGIFNSCVVQNNLRNLSRGKKLLDGGAPFYSVYQCHLDSYIAVGNLQPKFYNQMIRGLQLCQQNRQYLRQNQFNQESWQRIRQILNTKFKQKTAFEWQKILQNYDTCVTQVIDLLETSNYEKIIHPKLIRPKL